MANADLMLLSQQFSQPHSLKLHKNGARDDKLFIIVIKKMELTVLSEIYHFLQ